MKISKIEFVSFQILFWICCAVLPVLFINPVIESTSFFAMWSVDVLFAAIYFYLNLYYLIPQILGKNKFVMYIFTSICICAFFIVQQYAVDRFFYRMIFDSYQKSYLLIGRSIVTFLLIFGVSSHISYRNSLIGRDQNA